MIRKEYHTNFIIILNRRKCQCSSYLGLHFTLRLTKSAKLQGSADVHQEHHRQFALFLKHLDKRTAETCGHIPLDVSNVISVLILTHLGKSHSPTLKSGMIFTGKDVGRETAGLNLYLAYLL